MTLNKNRFILAVLCAFILCTALLGGCAKPNALEIAEKIVNDYAIDVADLGHKYSEFKSTTSLKFEIDGATKTEGYTFVYQKKNDIDIVNIVDTRISSMGVFEQWEVTEFYYKGWYMNFKTQSGATVTTLTPKRPDDVLGSGNDFNNYMSVSGRHSMPAETFNTDTLENLSAKRSGNRIVVTAKGAEASLADIYSAYYPNMVEATLKQGSYVGSKKLNSFSSITFEYIIKSDKIIKKTVVMTGKLNMTNASSQIITVDAKVTQVVDYAYSATAAIKDELKDVAD